MDLEALRASPVGQLVPISGYDPRRGREYDYFAFLPDALADDVELEQQTWIVVADAMAALGHLDQAGLLIPNPWLLRGPLLRREAVSTSALEGTYAPFADVLEADVADEGPQTPEVREVLNYVLAAEYAIKEVKNGRSISASLLTEAQALLMRGTKDEGPETGRLRTTQVLIGAEDCPIVDARFVPPPGDDRLQAGVDDWAAWLRRDRELPVIVQAALAHYQFETLHPFHDGNGRIGRLSVLLQLLQSGVLHEPLLEISPWFETRRRDYQDHLLDVSMTGHWDKWVRFFCTAICDQANDTCIRINRLLDFQSSTRELLKENNIRGVAFNIADELIGQPVLTATWAARRHDVTYPAANAAIGRLVRLGLLQEATGRTYGRIFRSNQVFTLLN
jgi:Fic family protein